MSRFFLVDDNGSVGLLTVDELKAMFRDVVAELLAETRQADEVVTVAGAAEALRVSEPTVLAMIADGRLSAVDVSTPGSARRHWRINLTRSLQEAAA